MDTSEAGKNRSRTPLAATGLALVAVLSACSGSPGTSAAPATTTSSSASSATAPTTPGTAGTPSPSVSSSPTPSVKQAAPVPVESNPPGDIPDNLAFVTYANAAGHYSFTHPEGWAETASGTAVRFTDKLNGVLVDTTSAGQTPTVDSARSTDVPRLKSTVPAFELRGITPVTVPAGKGVRIVFRRNSDPDSVTGRVYRDEVEEYVVFGSGRLVRMDLFGPVGADNVDAYRTMSQSLKIR